jgi:hypothetical protein
MIDNSEFTHVVPKYDPRIFAVRICNGIERDLATMAVTEYYIIHQ